MGLFPFSGEFFDLTITSFNNNFGREKIANSLYYGIETPIDKYIDELEEIGQGSQDDKSEKRVSRLKFLQSCSEDNVLRIFFSILVGWLNGGGDSKWNKTIPCQFSSGQYRNQNVILTVSGGNIYIIFAKLLSNIKWATQQPAQSISDVFNNLTKTNRNILEEISNRVDKHITKFVILEHIGKLLYNGPIYESLTEFFILNNTFSDFDYNLLPNMYPGVEEESKTYEISSLIRKLDSSVSYKNPAGFALFRIKSFISCQDETIQNYNEDQLKKNCLFGVENGIINKDLYNKLIPQLLNQSDLIIPGLQHEQLSECKKLVELLLKKKSMIKSATTLNIIKNFYRAIHNYVME